MICDIFLNERGKKMFYSERDAIDIYERKYSIQEIWWMDEDDRLLFVSQA